MAPRQPKARMHSHALSCNLVQLVCGARHSPPGCGRFEGLLTVNLLSSYRYNFYFVLGLKYVCIAPASPSSPLEGLSSLPKAPTSKLHTNTHRAAQWCHACLSNDGPPLNGCWVLPHWLNLFAHRCLRVAAMRCCLLTHRAACWRCCWSWTTCGTSTSKRIVTPSSLHSGDDVRTNSYLTLTAVTHAVFVLVGPTCCG